MMSKRIVRPKLAKYAEQDNYRVASPTSGFTDNSIISGVTVTKTEKLPPKWRRDTNTSAMRGGVGNRPYLREGLGQ